jgi:hypothetical protein
MRMDSQLTPDLDIAWYQRLPLLNTNEVEKNASRCFALSFRDLSTSINFLSH